MPLGGMLAGALVPPLVVAFGWQGAALGVAAVAVVIALLVEPLRSAVDGGRRVDGAPMASGPLAALRSLLGHARIRRLALVAFVYAGSQVTLSTFYVVFLTQAIGLSLVAAGRIDEPGSGAMLATPSLRAMHSGRRSPRSR